MFMGEKNLIQLKFPPPNVIFTFENNSQKYFMKTEKPIQTFAKSIKVPENTKNYEPSKYNKPNQVKQEQKSWWSHTF